MKKQSKKQISIEKDKIDYMSLGQDYLNKGEDMKAIRAFNKYLKNANDEIMPYF